MKLNTIFLRIVFSAVLCLLVVAIYAQPGNPSNDPDVPITGIEILIALGSVLGLRKFISSKQRRT